MLRLPDPRSKPWLTVAELASVTHEGEKAIRSAIDAGQLPVIRIGRYVRIPTALLLTQLGIDLDDTLEEHGSQAPHESLATATVHRLPRSTREEGQPHGAPDAG